VPPDLDWVVRLDVGRIYAALGATVVQGLRERALGSGAEGTERFLTDALQRSRIVVIAARYEAGRFADFVVALDGEFTGLDPLRYAASPAWQSPLDLGGDVRRYDRKRPKARSDVMRLYARGDDLLVAATEAELDSIEAVVERGAPPSRLSPRERGLVSAAVRTSFALPTERFPMLAGVFRGARTAEGFVDAHSDGFRVELSCELATEADAKQASGLVEAARAAFEQDGGRFASLARHTKVEANGAFVIVRAELVRDVLGDLVGEALR
jgi:hypothetical protein